MGVEGHELIAQVVHAAGSEPEGVAAGHGVAEAQGCHRDQGGERGGPGADAARGVRKRVRQRDRRCVGRGRRGGFARLVIRPGAGRLAGHERSHEFVRIQFR